MFFCLFPKEVSQTCDPHAKFTQLSQLTITSSNSPASTEDEVILPSSRGSYSTVAYRTRVTRVSCNQSAYN